MRGRPSPLLLPLLDTIRGLERTLSGRAGRLATVGLGLVVGWWLYVPVHELLHAGACWASGGEVQRLEIAPLYGGRLFAEWIPFVVAEDEYAGRLVGYDTRGSDTIYLATVLGAFLPTLFPGVWLLRRGAAGLPFLFGVALTPALAPFLSLTGDGYEIGSILVTAVGPWATSDLQELLRGDDLLKVAAAVHAQGGLLPWIAMAVAVVVGLAWALATYAVGDGISRLLGAGPVPPAVRWQQRPPLGTGAESRKRQRR